MPKLPQILAVPEKAPLYGSSRLGSRKERVCMNCMIATLPAELQGISYVIRGEKSYELSNHLGNVLAVVSDRREAGACTDSLVDFYYADGRSVSDYYPFGMAMDSRTQSAGGYRWGFNRQEKDDEVAGEGNSYTAEFWQYDSRVVQRWNIDPKSNPSFSDYSIIQGNPIWYSDHKGDTVRTNSEGFSNTKMGIDGILEGQLNPIGFNPDKGVLTYDESIDISGYSEFQQDILGRYKELITNKADVNLIVVDLNEKLDDLNGKSLNHPDIKAAGITVPFTDQDGAIVQLNVYVARNPVKSDGSRERKEYAGITNIHEAAGHAFLFLTQPALKTNAHNKLVEDLHKNIFLNFRIEGVIWYKRSSVPLHENVKE